MRVGHNARPKVVVTSRIGFVPRIGVCKSGREVKARPNFAWRRAISWRHVSRKLELSNFMNNSNAYQNAVALFTINCGFAGLGKRS